MRSRKYVQEQQTKHLHTCNHTGWQAEASWKAGAYLNPETHLWSSGSVTVLDTPPVNAYISSIPNYASAEH